MANGRLYQLSHCTYFLRYHIVWTPKYRGPVLSDQYIKTGFLRTFNQTAKWKGFVIHKLHIADDHIHIFMTMIDRPEKDSGSLI